MNPIEYLFRKYEVVFHDDDYMKTFLLKFIRPGASLCQISVIFKMASRVNNERKAKLLGGTL